MLLGAGGAYGYVQWRFGEIRHVAVFGLGRVGHSAQSRNDGSSIPPFTLLAIGSDTRNLGAGASAAFGSASAVGGQRSDSIILVRVVPRTRSLALLSIPRDTLVPIPGYGTTRINTAFNSGNPGLLVTVLQKDFGIDVNHVVEFNFDTFEQVADAVGGVEQWFPTPAKDDFSLLNVPAGCVKLTGAQALGFVRSREYQYFLNGAWHYQYYPESDLARIQRQQAFARDLVKKAKTKFGPTSVFELNNVIGSVTRNLTLDKSFSNSLLLSLATDYRSANLSAIPSYTYPAVNSTSVPGALDPRLEPGRAVIQEWLHAGRPAPRAQAASPAVTSGATGTAVSGAGPTTTTTVAGPAYAGTQTVDPASSSIYHGVYIPPGLVPGQTPQTCGE